MPGPDVPAIAIGIMKKKGLKPPDGDEPTEDAGPGHEVTPEELDGAQAMIQALDMKDPHAFAQALCDFIENYDGSGEGPSDASEAGQE